MQEELTRHPVLRTCVAIACIAAAPAFALSLGELEVRSALGEALEARIPLTLAPGEEPDPACFALTGDPTPGVPVIPDARLSIEHVGPGAALVLRTQRSLWEPAMRLRVRAGCPGQSGLMLRQYAVLLDPPAQKVAVTAPLAETPAPTPVVATPAPAARTAAPSPAGHASAARSSHRSARNGARDRRAASRAAASAPARGGFVLKLSDPEIDVSALRGMDEKERARLRERQLTLDADDQVAQVLALRNSVRQLEARVNDLQLKLAQMPATFAAAGTNAPDAARTASRDPRPAPTFTPRGWETFALWGAFLLVLGVLLLLVWRLTQRRLHEHHEAQPWPDEAGTAPASIPDAMQFGPAVAASAAGHDELRRRYLEERFPEVLNGTLALDDPASVVRTARLLHQDGALVRAVELLGLAIEDDPGEPRPWLALFEIQHAERMVPEFASLARRFHDQHGDGSLWRKVQQLGRELDPGNALYHDDGAAREPHEEWLDAPANARDEALATELRQALMARAGLTHQDLVPDPQAALRDAETFTVT